MRGVLAWIFVLMHFSNSLMRAVDVEKKKEGRCTPPFTEIKDYYNYYSKVY